VCINIYNTMAFVMAAPLAPFVIYGLAKAVQIKLASKVVDSSVDYFVDNDVEKFVESQLVEKKILIDMDIPELKEYFKSIAVTGITNSTIGISKNSKFILYFLPETFFADADNSARSLTPSLFTQRCKQFKFAEGDTEERQVRSDSGAMYVTVTFAGSSGGGGAEFILNFVNEETEDFYKIQYNTHSFSCDPRYKIFLVKTSEEVDLLGQQLLNKDNKTTAKDDLKCDINNNVEKIHKSIENLKEIYETLKINKNPAIGGKKTFRRRRRKFTNKRKK
jgi:hypothetical protein